MQKTSGYKIIHSYFKEKGWEPFPFQEEVWENYLAGKNGLLNAPTGSGKTFALFMPVLIDWINKHPEDYKTKAHNGLQLLWITPLNRSWYKVKSIRYKVSEKVPESVNSPKIINLIT